MVLLVPGEGAGELVSDVGQPRFEGDGRQARMRRVPAATDSTRPLAAT